MTVLYLVLGFLVGGILMAHVAVGWLEELRDALNQSERLLWRNTDLELENHLLLASLNSTRRTSRLVSRTTVPKHTERN